MCVNACVSVCLLALLIQSGVSTVVLCGTSALWCRTLWSPHACSGSPAPNPHIPTSGATARSDYFLCFEWSVRYAASIMLTGGIFVSFVSLVAFLKLSQCINALRWWATLGNKMTYRRFLFTHIKPTPTDRGSPIRTGTNLLRGHLDGWTDGWMDTLSIPW